MSGHPPPESGFESTASVRDRALTRIPDSPPRRAAFCAEPVESPVGLSPILFTLRLRQPRRGCIRARLEMCRPCVRDKWL
jgi:hypothetical protein